MHGATFNVGYTLAEEGLKELRSGPAVRTTTLSIAEDACEQGGAIEG